MRRVRKLFLAMTMGLVTAIAAAGVSAQPAAAAPAQWSVTNGVAKATGTKQLVGSPLRTYYEVTAELTVASNDGNCYYVRLYVTQDFLGSGWNTARQCGPGALSVTRNLYVRPFPYGLIIGLCKALPGAPEELAFATPGANCVRA